MTILTAILGIFLTANQIISSPNQHGRSGNNHLKQQQYEEAASAYRKGLSSIESTDQTYYGLQNNLGLSLHKQENFEEALKAFSEALSSAPNSDASAKTAFNAGNNAFDSQQLEQALAHYQSALMADPDNEDAKFNFEFVSRQLQEQQQSDGDDQQQNDEEQTQDQQGQNQDQTQNQQKQNQDQTQNQQQEQDSQQNQQQHSEEESQDEQPAEQSDAPSTPLTREQAERILEALENEEEELLREVQKIEGRPRRVTKDW